MIFQIFFARLLGRKEREARGRLLSQDFIFGVYRAEYGLYNRRVLSCPSFFLYCVYIFSRFIYATTQTLPGLFTRRKPPSRKSQGPCDAVARILHLFNFASIDAAAIWNHNVEVVPKKNVKSVKDSYTQHNTKGFFFCMLRKIKSAQNSNKEI